MSESTPGALFVDLVASIGGDANPFYNPDGIGRRVPVNIAILSSLMVLFY